MKVKLFTFSILLSIISLSSCQLLKEGLEPVETANSGSNSKFLKNIELEGSSYTLQTNKEKSTYKFSEEQQENPISSYLTPIENKLEAKRIAHEKAVAQAKKLQTPSLNTQSIGFMDANELVVSIYEKVETCDTTLARFIEEWMGVPYRYGGLTKKGIDCSAFTRTLYNEVYKKPLLRTASAQYSTVKTIKAIGDLKEGDLVFFKIKKRYISHVGVYLSDGYFVQASSSRGVVISNLEDRYWKKYFIAGGRIDG